MRLKNSKKNLATQDTLITNCQREVRNCEKIAGNEAIANGTRTFKFEKMSYNKYHPTFKKDLLKNLAPLFRIENRGHRTLHFPEETE